MPKPPRVLVAVGMATATKGNIPQQTYKHMWTEFNIGSLGTTNDGDFYNTIVRSPSIQDIHEFDIYGFLPSTYNYAHNNSIQRIVDFFQANDNIEIVICDMLTIHNNDWQSYQYTHPHAPNNNIPFFIKGSIKDKITFTNDDLMFQTQLKKLQQEEHIIYHIAEPLLLTHKGSE